MNLCIGYNKEFQYLLNNYNNNSLSNSIIISGQKGIGKETFVMNFIKNVFKLECKDNFSHHINLIDNNSHPNIRNLSKLYDEKLKKHKNFISIDQVRNINNFLNETSLNKLNKFIIIDSVDDMNISSSNSLLKSIEEPKNNNYFFLISHQLSSLLPTIRSRCLKLKFKNHDFANFKLILNDKIDIKNDETIKFLFDLSNGSPGDAIDFYNDNILEFYEEILNSLVEINNISNFNIDLSNKISKLDDNNFRIFLYLLKFILINLNKSKIGIKILDNYLSKNLDFLVQVSKNISLNTINKKLEYLIKNENDLFTYNLDKKIFVLNFFTKL